MARAPALPVRSLSMPSSASQLNPATGQVIEPAVATVIAPAAASGSPWLRGILVTLLLAALTVFFTWPMAQGLSSLIVWHIDPPFSVWRLAWVAHQLFIDPVNLFNTNIYYPEPRTLAYSDAMLLQGLIATPLIKAGMKPLLVMNLMFLAGILTSGAGMYLLARRLTGHTAAAILAAMIYSFAPYRADHNMHLELQWAVWIPLTLWAFHRTLSEGRARDGVLTGVFLICQLLSSIYYALFLMASLWRSRLTRPVIAGFAVGGVLLVMVAVPYSQPYRENAKALGHRPAPEIVRYSATAASYLAVTPEHAMLGRWTGDWSGSETRLFPGMIAVLLVALALVPPVCAVRWLYVAVLLFAIECSFGLNGRLYPLLHDWLTPFKGLRAPGRFGILVLLGVSVLAAYGAARLLSRTPASWRRPLALLLGGVMLLEYQTAQAYMETLPVNPPDVYRWLSREPHGTVTVEYPLPLPEAVPLNDPFYMYFSTMHWQPLLNGYSGHYPVSYMQMLESQRTFPDDASIAALRARGVKAIIVHANGYRLAHMYEDATKGLEARSDVRLMGIWKDHRGEARAYKFVQ
jgi:hypothetical protein